MNLDNEESGYEETLELLREAHREAIPEAHFAAVRARVLAQLEVRQRPWRRWIWQYPFAAAAAAILAVAFWPKHAVERALPPVPALAVHQPAPAAEQPPPQVVARVAHPRRRHLTAIAAPYRVIGPPVPPQPLVVKLITNDPNVVIYWITGE